VRPAIAPRRAFGMLAPKLEAVQFLEAVQA